MYVGIVPEQSSFYPLSVKRLNTANGTWGTAAVKKEFHVSIIPLYTVNVQYLLIITQNQPIIVNMKHFYRYALAVLLLFTAILFFSCKSRPEIQEDTIITSLLFTDIEAESPDYLYLHFLLEVQNNYPTDIPAEIYAWRVVVNGRDAPSGFTLDYPGDSFMIVTAVPMTLGMDVPALIQAGLAPEDDYIINLILELGLSGYGDTLPRLEVSGIAEFPGVQSPVFSITSIAILQAELVNTLFRVGIVIDNPNPFPVDLNAFGYTLYGNDMLWADGYEREITDVEGKSSLHGNIFLMMNFIDMGRALFDQVVRLEDVNYRFTGEAVVITGVDYLPRFGSSFDLSGYSRVYGE